MVMSDNIIFCSHGKFVNITTIYAAKTGLFKV